MFIFLVLANFESRAANLNTKRGLRKKVRAQYYDSATVSIEMPKSASKHLHTEMAKKLSFHA